ncbi:MAG: OstA-like protein, partial [Candidatus Zixiibacteriota bacterium]
MRSSNYIALSFLMITMTLVPSIFAQEKREIVLKHSDELEVVLVDGRYVTHVTGHVVFETESGTIECNSATWDRGRTTLLSGNVKLRDKDFRIDADSVDYNLRTRQAIARGDKVELWSFTDSIYAIGTYAFFDREKNHLKMHNRPLLYLRYPDSANMIEVLADTIEYSSTDGRADATGNVRISSSDLNATSQRGVFVRDRDSLE